uniref:Uncharacterized protein n=1 Tax=Mola mola TaxID=94237 RepID=A0A3Q3WIL7_MOLML
MRQHQLSRYLQASARTTGKYILLEKPIIILENLDPTQVANSLLCRAFACRSTAECLEAALNTLSRALETNCDNPEVWSHYLSLFSRRGSKEEVQEIQSKLVSDLVQRCLSTVPSRLELPFNPSVFWSCYRFHNQVVALYLSCLPQPQLGLVLERLRCAMPNNTELGLRLLHQEWQDGNMEQLKFQARMLSSNSPKCLNPKRDERRDDSLSVRLLYQQALHNLPLCAALWKHRLLFEAAEGGQTDRLARLLDRCQQVGVSLSE